MLTNIDRPRHNCSDIEHCVGREKGCVFITSIPKAGTHLLATVVAELVGHYPVSVKVKNKDDLGNEDFSRFNVPTPLVGHFRHFHVLQSQALRALIGQRKLLILIRDPRDICISMLHYLAGSTNANHRTAWKQIEALTLHEQIMKIANGIDLVDNPFRVAPLNEHCEGFLELQRCFPDSCLLRFEEFFEPPVVEKIACFLDMRLETVSLALGNALTNGSKTKRKGVPNAWKQVFDQHLTDFFATNFGRLIEELGYPLS